MAVSLKKSRFSTNLKTRLKYLECPYVEDMDEHCIADLLLSPGEGRLKILQWLFVRYNSKLEELLEPRYMSMGSRTESRLQQLLTAAHAMCLCAKDDIDLIRGEGPLARQMDFIERLVELVCFRDKASGAHASKGSAGSSMEQCCQYIGSLVSQDGYCDLLTSNLDLLPKDIRAEVDKLTELAGDKDRTRQQLSIHALEQQSVKLAEELEKHKKTLQALKASVMLQGEGKTSELETMTQLLAVVIRELQQLADGFTHCYESRISQWCHRQPPELTQLGATFKRVDLSLLELVKLLESLSRVRQIHSRLKGRDVGSHVLVQVSRDARDSFHQCLSVLEETLHRSDSSFTTRYTANHIVL